ncbi:MAG: tetratricopeptide repeat protein, partial [Akkermansiaceae bacterium]|nr:tetratricopeptide repeat protein [Akkermansiaceae bacterium]
MAEETSNPAPLGEIEHGPSKFEAFLDEHQKKLILLFLALIVAASGYIVLTGLKETEDTTAGEALVSAEGIAALRDVMEAHAGTPAAGSAAILLADEQWKDGRRPESIASLRQFLADQPDHPAAPTARMALGMRLLEQDKKDEATAIFQEVIDDPNAKHLAPFALFALGDLQRAAGKEDEAKALFERARDDFPENSLSITQLANERISLLGVAPPKVVTPPPAPAPGTTPPAIPGLPASGNAPNPLL